MEGNFILSFNYVFPEMKNATIYFAFCYPYTYEECQTRLEELDRDHREYKKVSIFTRPENTIYYHRELLCYSLDNLRVDLITVSSLDGQRDEEEERIPLLFPGRATPRARRFDGKKVRFLISFIPSSASFRNKRNPG